MFCPKCGGQNPDDGKFCRSCGTALGNVSQALAGKAPQPRHLTDHKGKPVSWDGAIVKIFSGLAFVAVAIALAFSQMGRGWWFWMLIPAFGSLGKGVAQYVQLRKAEKGEMTYPSSPDALSPAPNTALPPPQTVWTAPESIYKTGDLVPPSVTDGTTRHLEIDREGQTMTLPKK